MCKKVQTQAKIIMDNGYSSLFFITFLSFLLRYGSISALVFSVYSFFKDNAMIIEALVKQYGDFQVYSAITLIISSLSLSVLLFICALKTGEEYIYFSKCIYGSFKIKNLFKYIHPKKAFKSAVLYFKLWTLKMLWALYFFLPSAVSIVISFLIYSNYNLLNAVKVALLLCCTALCGLSLFMMKIAFYRYGKATYFLIAYPKLKSSEIIKKSITRVDGELMKFSALDSSFFGWFLTCVCIFTIPFTATYYKLSRHLLIIKKECSAFNYGKAFSINFLGLAEKPTPTTEAKSKP